MHDTSFYTVLCDYINITFKHEHPIYTFKGIIVNRAISIVQIKRKTNVSLKKYLKKIILGSVCDSKEAVNVFAEKFVANNKLVCGKFATMNLFVVNQ